MIPIKEVTYRDIEHVLMHKRHGKSTIMPRFTPMHWWECDVCEVTASGYLREFEIKMSRSDFKADAGKERRTWDFSQPPTTERKHDLLAAGDERGPNTFYYVTPKGLLQLEEIPVWAGWIEVGRDPNSNYPFERVQKPAPRLHQKKADPKLASAMRQSAYGRLHGQWFDEYYSELCARLEREQKYKLLHPERKEPA